MGLTDFRLSLTELEKSDWGAPSPNDTDMIRRCHQIRYVPLNELTNDDLRLSIGQRLGIPFILDLAMKRLEDDPLLEGDCYPGDVLAALLRLPAQDWNDRAELKPQLAELLENVMNLPYERTRAFREVLSFPPTDRMAH